MAFCFGLLCLFGTSLPGVKHFSLCHFTLLHITYFFHLMTIILMTSTSGTHVVWNDFTPVSLSLLLSIRFSVLAQYGENCGENRWNYCVMYLSWFLSWSVAEALCILMFADLSSDLAFMANLQTVMFYSGSGTKTSSVHKLYTPPCLFHTLASFLAISAISLPPSHCLGHLILQWFSRIINKRNKHPFWEHKHCK